MIKTLSIVMIMIACFFAVGCKDKEDKDYITELVLSDNFLNASFDIGDNVDFSNYTLTVKYNKANDLVLPLNNEEITIINFSTATVGSFTGTVKYKDKSVNFNYTIHDIEYIKSLTLSEGFNNKSYYVGDVVNLANYTLTVDFNLAEDLVLDLSDNNITIANFSTEVVGTFIGSLTYRGVSVNFNYIVVEPQPIGIYYNGENIVLYASGENDLSKVIIDVVYENGAVKYFSLEEINFDLTKVNLECSTVVKNLSVDYLGFETLIGYTVTNPPIEAFTFYEFVDNTGDFSEECKYICRSTESFLYYESLEGGLVLETNLKAGDFNTYEFKKVSDGQIKTYVIKRTNDKVVCELK